MIITLEDILDDLEQDYPEITRESLKKICKKGLAGINKLLRSGDEVLLTGPMREEMKFYTALPEDIQVAKMRKKYYFKKKQQQDAKTSSSK